MFAVPPTGGEPVLCLQKGILSPSCPEGHYARQYVLIHRQLSATERDF